MANIQERRDKTGKLISYSIRVHRGRGANGKQLKPWTTTFEVSPTWTEKAQKRRLRLSPQPLRKNVRRVSPLTAVRNSPNTVTMCFRQKKTGA